jgi:hypothetical protein
MIKQGSTKLPLDKVGLLARSLELDPAKLFWAVIAEYAPETYRAIDETAGGVLLKPHEREIIAVHRELIGDREVTGVKIAKDRKSFAVYFVSDSDSHGTG